MSFIEKYNLWLENVTCNEDLMTELTLIKDNIPEIEDRFAKQLEFGTAGLRGIIGAGTYRMNVYTVRQATQGLADYLNSKFDTPSVAIAYDSRIKSDLFAREAASVLAGNNIKVYIYGELMPTPSLSFAIRKLGASSGIVVTASHNPSKYNGYKVYGSDGCQLTDDAAGTVLQNIRSTDIFTGVKYADFEQSLTDGMISIIGEDVIDEFVQNVKACRVCPEATVKSDLKVVYTPLNGTGNKLVRRVLKEIGIENVEVVKEQELPDGNFTTTPIPNPDRLDCFTLAVQKGNAYGADLLVATDPDADRVGIMVRRGDKYYQLSGNEVGCLLMEYILKVRKETGTLPQNPVAVTTVVSTPLATVIGEKHGAKVISVLTGFKYIGEQIAILEEKNEEYRFVLGFEESYGYLGGIYVRDKDAIVASMLICEMASYYKKSGKSLLDVMDDIYKEYGMYLNLVANYSFEGISGLEKMSAIMTNLRENNPKQIGDVKVTGFTDYLKQVRINIATEETSPTGLPRSNVLEFVLENGSSFVVRPSGTEPLIRVYFNSKARNKEAAETTANEMKIQVTKILGL